MAKEEAHTTAMREKVCLTDIFSFTSKSGVIHSVASSSFLASSSFESGVITITLSVSPANDVSSPSALSAVSTKDTEIHYFTRSMRMRRPERRELESKCDDVSVFPLPLRDSLPSSCC